MDAHELRAYLERCDAVLFEDPPRGFELARSAPELARQNGNPELIALSLAIQAGSYRAIGQHDKAEEIYNEALALRRQCSPLTLADIYRRLAGLRWSQHKYSEGIEIIEKSLAIYKKTTRNNDIGWTHNVRGMLYFGGSHDGHPWLTDSIQDFSEALHLVDPRTAPHVAFSALHNLVVAAAEGPSRPEDLLKALDAISRFNLPPDTVPAAKLLWLRGVIALRFGSDVYAANFFESARNQLARLGLPMETALVSLDLGAIQHRNEEWKALEQTAAHAVMLFRDVYPFATLTALTMWRESILNRELDEAMELGLRRAVATQDARFLNEIERPKLQALEPMPTSRALPDAASSAAPPSPSTSSSKTTLSTAAAPSGPPHHLLMLKRAHTAFGPQIRSQRRYSKDWTGRPFRLKLEPLEGEAVDYMAREENLSRPEFIRRRIRRAAGLPARNSRRLKRRQYPPFSGYVCLNLEPEEAAAVDRSAKDAHVARSEYVRRLIRQAMRERGLTLDATPPKLAEKPPYAEDIPPARERRRERVRKLAKEAAAAPSTGVSEE